MATKRSGLNVAIPVSTDASGFDQDQGARRAAVAAETSQRVAQMALLRRTTTGGPLGYFTDTADAARADAPNVAAAARIAALGSVPAVPAAAVKAAALAPKAVTPAQAVDQAMTQGRTADSYITPQDQLSAYIGSVLSRGATIREAQALGPLVPGLARATPNPKQAVLGQTAALSQSIYQNSVTQAQELAKTDPEGARKVVEQATSDYFNRNAGLVGFDPSKLVQAQLLAGNNEDN